MLAFLAGAGWLFLSLFADPALAAHQLSDARLKLELVGAAVTAATAVIAAFHIQVRGRTLPWRTVPLALFATWQILSIYRCLNGPQDGPAEEILNGRSPDCFLFILAASIPIALVLFWVLGTQRRYVGWSASAMAGLAISSFAAFLLQFFHGFEMDFGDWSIRFLAMGIVVGSSAYVGQMLPTRSI